MKVKTNMQAGQCPVGQLILRALPEHSELHIKLSGGKDGMLQKANEYRAP